MATAHSLLWNDIKPVFVDIDPETLNLDPAKVEAAITPHIIAIMAVHCCGILCDVKALQNIADNYNLKIIYNAQKLRQRGPQRAVQLTARISAARLWSELVPFL